MNREQTMDQNDNRIDEFIQIYENDMSIWDSKPSKEHTDVTPLFELAIEKYGNQASVESLSEALGIDPVDAFPLFMSPDASREALKIRFGFDVNAKESRSKVDLYWNCWSKVQSKIRSRVELASFEEAVQVLRKFQETGAVDWWGVLELEKDTNISQLALKCQQATEE